MHDDDELSALTGSRIRERITLHEWSLSSVQKVTCEDGRSLVYKSQYGPTVESEFYASATSPILPRARTVWQSDLHSCMLIEFIEAPLIGDLKLSEDQMLGMTQQIVDQIREVSGDPPVFLDIGTLDKWLLLVDRTIASVAALVKSGRFQLTSLETLGILDRLAHSSMVASEYDQEIGLVHTDLNKRNIFVCPDGYRVVDWQRPIRGPRAIDKIDLLRNLGVDTSKHVSRGAVVIWSFLTIWWYEQWQTRWVTAGTYDGWIGRWSDG
jgi:hypothetical protein